MQRMAKSSVLLYGAGGLGIEIGIKINLSFYQTKKKFIKFMWRSQFCENGSTGSE